jgi:hypothetical protein
MSTPPLTPISIGDRVRVDYGPPHPGYMYGRVRGVLWTTRMAYVVFDVGGLPEWVSFDKLAVTHGR